MLKWRKCGVFRWVGLDVASASFFSRPLIRITNTYIQDLWLTRVNLWRIRPTNMEDMKLLFIIHPSSGILLNFFWCVPEVILGRGGLYVCHANINFEIIGGKFRGRIFILNQPLLGCILHGEASHKPFNFGNFENASCTLQVVLCGTNPCEGVGGNLPGVFCTF